MTRPVATISPLAAPSDDRLRRACQTLEGAFLGQLLRAMRGAEPEPALLPAAPGQDLFAGLLDEHVASAAARRLSGGLGEALYRQLLRRAHPA